MQQFIIQFHVQGSVPQVRALASSAQCYWNARGLAVLSKDVDQTAHIVNMRPSTSWAGKDEMLQVALARMVDELEAEGELVVSDLQAW